MFDKVFSSDLASKACCISLHRPGGGGNPCLDQQNMAAVSVQRRQVQGLCTERSLKPCVSPVSAHRKGQLIFTKALTWEFCTLYLSGREGSANRHVAHIGH